MTPELKAGVIIILAAMVLAFGSGVAVGLLLGLRKKERHPTGHDSPAAGINS